MTPDDYTALYNEARNEPAFSNSDEGIAWMDANCATCIHEKPTRQGNETEGCPLILVALMDKRPAQWLGASPQATPPDAA